MGFVAKIKSWLRPRLNADRLARQLLREVLSPEQRAQYDSKGFFEVTGGQTGMRYRIRTGSQMNVEELDRAEVRGADCASFQRVECQSGNILLAQKLALELMEEETLKVAGPAAG